MIWTVWDLEELTEASVARDHSGWRLNLEGAPLGFDVSDKGTPPGVYLTFFFREREQIERALDELKRLALALEEMEILPPGESLEPLPRVALDQEVRDTAAYDHAAESGIAQREPGRRGERVI